MRETFKYEVDCVCGQHIMTNNTAFACHKCGRIGIIQWERRDQAPKDDKRRQMPDRRSA